FAGSLGQVKERAEQAEAERDAARKDAAEAHATVIIHQEDIDELHVLAHDLREALDAARAVEAERDALRLALRDCAILLAKDDGDASDWFQCGLCSAVWRTRESHRSDCLLALAQ